MSRWLAGVIALAACDPPRPIPPDSPLPDAPLLCIRGPIGMNVTTLAGCEQPGTDDGDRETARFSNPTAVELGPDGSLFVADFDNDLLRKIDRDGVTTTVIQREGFISPFGLMFDGDRTLWIETDDNDEGVHSDDTGTIWKLDLPTNELTVIARNLGRPRGLVLLPDGRIAMADHVHHMLSILDPNTGVTIPLAGLRDTPGFANGQGDAVRFAQPYELIIDPDSSDLLVTELDNRRIRRVALDGTVSDYAGTGNAGSLDGPLAVATFDGPQAIAVAADKSIYVTDIRRSVIRRIKDGVVKTIAGDGTAGWIDSDDPRGARFYGVEGIAVDDAKIIVGDGNRGDEMPFNRIRVIELDSIAQ